MDYESFNSEAIELRHVNIPEHSLVLEGDAGIHSQWLHRSLRQLQPKGPRR